jgi:hypothetical protein
MDSRTGRSMRDLQTLSAGKLLGIPEVEPERLFSGDAGTAKSEFRRLAMRWHPDRNRNDPAAENVFTHVDALFKNAIRKIETGGWHEPAVKIEDEEANVLVLRADAGRRPLKRIRYRKHAPFELGDCYIGRTIVAYVVKNDYADLFENACRVIAGFRYGSSAMRDEVCRSLPSIETVFYSGDRCVMVVRKAPDLICLRDVLDHVGGRLDPRHVAWIGSTLYNLACYLAWAHLTHNAFSLNNYFISPPDHTGALLGGWWYAKPEGAKLEALPAPTRRYCPPDVLRDKRADGRTDLELVRAIAREVLGDGSGMRLAAERSAPPQMIDWLRHPTTGCAVADYRQWSETILPASFGKRRFTRLELSASDIYKEE